MRDVSLLGYSGLFRNNYIQYRRYDACAASIGLDGNPGRGIRLTNDSIREVLISDVCKAIILKSRPGGIAGNAGGNVFYGFHGSYCENPAATKVNILNVLDQLNKSFTLEW